MTTPAFRQRWPWIGPDLQTLRDTLRPECLPPERAFPLQVPVTAGDQLLALVDPASSPGGALGLVVLVHGLGGDSGRLGVRRLALHLQQVGFRVWRLNLRGAGPGRPLARGTYAAACTADLLPVLERAREAAAGLPLLGVGLSLGGTVLLNALREQPDGLDALACVSSPLELAASSLQIERPRNRLYARWLLRRLVAQTLADPFGLQPRERLLLEGPQRPRSIRAFDAAVTAPRWGYDGVDHYYAAASPGPQLQAAGRGQASLGPWPPTLLVHALDDPWVPAAQAQALAEAPPPGWDVLLSPRGGHNGFHAAAEGAAARPSLQPAPSWADRQVAGWLQRLLSEGRLKAPASLPQSAEHQSRWHG